MRRVPVIPAPLLLTLVATIALIAAPGASAARQPETLPDTQVAPAVFSSPHHAVTGEFFGVAAVVDSTNHVHIAATGKGGVWYITDRGGWTAHRILKNPVDSAYETPLIAIDEHDRVHIAATKWQGPDVPNNMGTFYVTDKGRTQGTFPAVATRIAAAGKSGTSLKVGNGHVYLTMEPAWCGLPDGCGLNDPVWFRTNASGHWVTTTLGIGYGSSMRLATNGRARIVYATQNGLQYAVAATVAGGFSTTKIPNTSGKDFLPVLSMDAQGHSAVAWTHDTGSGRTARYSTRKSGSWSVPVTVASASNGFDAFSFDIDTLGRPHIVLANADNQMLRDKRLAGGAWTTVTIAGPVSVNAVSVRRAFSGIVVVAWATNTGIYVSRG